MARYRDAVCKLCRREGQKLFLKGDRCYGRKCSVDKRPFPPGQHGQGRKKLSEYGLQLRAKQKAKRFYGVLEGQFHKYFVKATKMTGKTGTNLLQLLESRLDNVAYRLGFGTSRAQARQVVLHKHLLVNGKRVNIPSYLVQPGDMISICEKSLAVSGMKAILEKTEPRVAPAWLDYDKTTKQGKMLKYPERSEIDLEVEEHLIVELYSK